MNVAKMRKLMAEVVEELEELKQTELARDLSWCWISFKNDQNPIGIIDSGFGGL